MTDDLNNQLLLSIQSACNHSGVKIPWDEVGNFMTDPKHGGPVTEGAIVQHLAKMRGQLAKDGQPVPKPLKRGGQQRANLDAQANSINVTESTALGVHIHHTGPDIMGGTDPPKIKKEKNVNSHDPDDGDSSGEYGKKDTGRTKLHRQAKDKAKKARDEEEFDDELQFKFEEAYLNGKKSTNMEDGGHNGVASGLDSEPDYEDLADDESVVESENGSNYPIADDGYVLVPAVVACYSPATAESSDVSSNSSFVCAGAAFLPKDNDVPEMSIGPSLVATFGWGKNANTYMAGFNELQKGGVIDQDTLPPAKYMMMSPSFVEDFDPDFTTYSMPTIDENGPYNPEAHQGSDFFPGDNSNHVANMHTDYGNGPYIPEADHGSDFFPADNSNHVANMPTTYENGPYIPEADHGSDVFATNNSNLVAEPEEEGFTNGTVPFDIDAAMESNEEYGTIGEWISARWWHDRAVAEALATHHRPTANDYAWFVRNSQTGVYENPTFDQGFTSGADQNVGDYGSNPFNTNFMEIADFQFS